MSSRSNPIKTHAHHSFLSLSSGNIRSSHIVPINRNKSSPRRREPQDRLTCPCASETAKERLRNKVETEPRRGHRNRTRSKPESETETKPENEPGNQTIEIGQDASQRVRHEPIQKVSHRDGTISQQDTENTRESNPKNKPGSKTESESGSKPDPSSQTFPSTVHLFRIGRLDIRERLPRLLRHWGTCKNPPLEPD